MMDKDKLCISCKNNLKEEGRNYCHACYLSRRRKFYYKRKEKGILPKRYGKSTCFYCGKEIIKGSKEQKYCLNCYRYIQKKYGNNASNNYLYDKKGKCQHRKLVEKLLGRKLHTDEVVHHIDENPKNNNINNLIVIYRQKHAVLHSFLRDMRAFMEKSINEQNENCWNILRDQITTTWLETTGVKVIKISDIGQSASEPLSL